MSEKKSKPRQRGRVRDHKMLPADQAAEMNKVERIIAHIQDGFFLDDEALRYMQKLEQVFVQVFNYNTKAQAARIVVNYFRCSPSDAYALLKDVQEVYGDFFQVNKAAKRYLQEMKYQRLHDEAIAQGDLHAANRSLENIDKLHDLYNPEESYVGNANRVLPRVRRTSNPAVLQKLYIDEEE